MNTDEYITDKLMSNYAVKDLLESMKKQGHLCYVAGGAMTAIATGNHDKIADYDVYFSDVDSAVSAIRYMKDLNPHVGFISDKSITYVINNTTKIQFIYYAFYPTANDIFNHFDFTINMMAYNNIEEKLYTHENFWLHNAQRYLHINKDTFYPILSNLRVQKYVDKGYHTSRSEITKLSLAISSLNINTWVEAKAQLGNSYGYTLADFKKYENTEFSMEALFELLEKGMESSDILTGQDCYLYPIDCVDFVLLNKPIEVMIINGEEYYVNEFAQDCNGLDSLINEGILQKVTVSAGSLLSGQFYLLSDKCLELDQKVHIDGWNSEKVYTTGQVPKTHPYKYVYRVRVVEESIVSYQGDNFRVSSYTPLALVTDISQI